MGVWIEINSAVIICCDVVVTPLVGVWIEIFYFPCPKSHLLVTPLVGVWIEIICRLLWCLIHLSHSPCGSVD